MVLLSVRTRRCIRGGRAFLVAWVGVDNPNNETAAAKAAVPAGLIGEDGAEVKRRWSDFLRILLVKTDA